MSLLKHGVAISIGIPVLLSCCIERAVAAESLSASTSTFERTTISSSSSNTELSHRPKIALALGGGGMRGAAHVGVLRVLEREHIPIDMIAGTSIGAIIGGLYCAGLSVPEIESKFTTPTIMRSYMSIPISVSILTRPFWLMPRLVGWRPYDGFYFGTKFRKYYSSCLPAGKKNIEDLNKPFEALAMNLVDGKEVAIKTGDLSRAVQASSAIPVLRRPIAIGDAVLVDGAVTENVPIDPAREMGADFVIAVPVDERLNVMPGDSFRKVGSVGRRMEQIFLTQVDAPELDRADAVIHPLTDGISVTSTRSKDAINAIEEGEKAANLAIPEIRRKLAEWQAKHPNN